MVDVHVAVWPTDGGARTAARTAHHSVSLSMQVLRVYPGTLHSREISRSPRLLIFVVRSPRTSVQRSRRKWSPVSSVSPDVVVLPVRCCPAYNVECTIFTSLGSWEDSSQEPLLFEVKRGRGRP
jgi:hypothetical protein